MGRKIAFCGLLLLMSSCGNESSTVHGRIEYRFVQQDPEQSVPVDLSSYQFKVYVEDGSRSGFSAYPHTDSHVGSADGWFAIPDVQEGPFWLRYNRDNAEPTFVRAEEHEIAWKWAVLGRPDAAPVTRPTPLFVRASGLAPWLDGDLLVATCWSNATENYGVNEVLQPALTAGATAIDASFDWSAPGTYSWGPGGGPFLMNASVDGEFVLARITETIMANARVRTLVQVLTTATVTQRDGEATSVTGAFADVSVANNVKIGIDLDAVAANLPRGLLLNGFGTSLLAGPGALFGLHLGPSLLQILSTQRTGPFIASESYGNPFDPSWPVVVRTNINLAHEQLDFPLNSLSNLWEEALLADGKYEFKIPPIAEAAKINGLLIDGEELAWDGVSPMELSFDVTAEISGVYVTVYRLHDHQPIANFSADRPPLLLPADVFRPDEAYAFRIGVWWQSPSDDGARGSYHMTPAIRLRPL